MLIRIEFGKSDHQHDRTKAIPPSLTINPETLSWCNKCLVASTDSIQPGVTSRLCTSHVVCLGLFSIPLLSRSSHILTTSQDVLIHLHFPSPSCTLTLSSNHPSLLLQYKCLSFSVAFPQIVYHLRHRERVCRKNQKCRKADQHLPSASPFAYNIATNCHTIPHKLPVPHPAHIPLSTSTPQHQPPSLAVHQIHTRSASPLSRYLHFHIASPASIYRHRHGCQNHQHLLPHPPHPQQPNGPLPHLPGHAQERLRR
jgi:hypothetical protein